MSNSTYEQKPGQGSLFRNTRKETENQADFSGTIKLPDGTECWINGWEKTDRNGNPWYSLSVRPKQEQRSAPAPAPRREAPKPAAQPARAATAPIGDLDDTEEIPF
jgi:hypothetical protein